MYHKKAMPITPRRRHSARCKFRKIELTSKDLDRCSCPIILIGMDTLGRYHDREHTHTQDKHIAARIIRQIEDGVIPRPLPQSEQAGMSIAKAIEGFKEVLIGQKGLKPSSVGAQQACYNSLLRFTESKKIQYLRDVKPTDLNSWIATWKLADSTKAQRVNLVKRMFNLATAQQWDGMTINPAIMLMHPPVERVGKTEPFELRQELPKIMEMIPRWMEGMRFQRRIGMSVWAKYPETAAALMLVLRWTGLRISDAFRFNPRSLTREVVNGKEMYLYLARQKKTERQVFLPLRPDDMEPVLRCRWIGDDYPFWDGKTDTTSWNNLLYNGVLKHMERLCGIPVHAHRFRDTFAVDLLSRRADIRSVSRLLGHKNVATTLTYYEHYVKADQDLLTKIVMDAYDTDTEPRSLIDLVA